MEIVRLDIAGTFFTWDLAKAEANLRKHGVSFEAAAHAFFDPMFLISNDPHPDGDRVRLIGFSDAAESVLFVVYAERVIMEDVMTYRIISARKAVGKEREMYDER